MSESLEPESILAGARVAFKREQDKKTFLESTQIIRERVKEAARTAQLIITTYRSAKHDKSPGKQPPSSGRFAEELHHSLTDYCKLLVEIGTAGDLWPRVDHSANCDSYLSREQDRDIWHAVYRWAVHLVDQGLKGSLQLANVLAIWNDECFCDADRALHILIGGLAGITNMAVIRDPPPVDGDPPMNGQTVEEKSAELPTTIQVLPISDHQERKKEPEIDSNPSAASQKCHEAKRRRTRQLCELVKSFINVGITDWDKIHQAVTNENPDLLRKSKKTSTLITTGWLKRLYEQFRRDHT